MREIKFRAWHNKEKQGYQMLYPHEEPGHKWIEAQFHDQLLITTDGTPVLYFCDIAYLRMVDVVLMQYTGLKDKNGVEIYEGDIIICPSWVRLTDSSERTKATVIWHTDGYAAKIKSERTPYSLTGDWQRTEVIGNIYENPELKEGI